MPKITNRQALLGQTPMVFDRTGESCSILAVDPGEKHVGVAVGSRASENTFGWLVTGVSEMTPWGFVQFFKDNIHKFDIVTCERFTLYPSLAKEQHGSEMPTSKLIGWIEFTVRLWNEEQTKDPGSPAYGYPEIQYESNPAAIQQGTTAVMKTKAIPFRSPATPDHARSAELHLWHTLIRGGLVTGVKLA